MAINFYDLSEAKQTKVIALVAEKMKYSENKIGAETEAQFVKRIFGEQMVELAVRYHREKVAAAALAADPGVDL